MGSIYDKDADVTARQVRNYHRKIEGINTDGQPYRALEPETFWWTHATFHRLMEYKADWYGEPLSSGQREQLYAEPPNGGGVTNWVWIRCRQITRPFAKNGTITVTTFCK